VWCRPHTLARRDAGAILIEAMSSVLLTGARFDGNSAVAGAGGRGLHSSTSQLNLSRF
jgi:hypothetical protein